MEYREVSAIGDDHNLYASARPASVTEMQARFGY